MRKVGYYAYVAWGWVTIIWATVDHINGRPTIDCIYWMVSGCSMLVMAHTFKPKDAA